MTIVFDKQSSIHVLFYMGDERGDVIAALWKRDDTEPWKISVRVRTNGDGKYDPFDPKNNDRKTWMEAVLKAGADLDGEASKLRESMMQIARGTGVGRRKVDGGTIVALEERHFACDGATAMERLMADPPSWLHVKPRVSH